MGFAPFFDRIYSAVGGHLSVSRDDLAASLRDVNVGIKFGSSFSQNDFWIAELATNLLARLYPNLAIVGPEPHVSSLRTLALKINPDITLIESSPPEMTVGIGTDLSGATLLPNATGWVARLDHSLSRSSRSSGPTNPYAAGFAAGLAAAELFRRIFVTQSLEDDFSVSLLNFDQCTGSDFALSASNLGTVIFVAVGAVGNAAIWALERDVTRSGTLVLVDDETLELSNLQRYILGTVSDISKPKVHLAQEHMEQSQFSVEAFKGTLEDFADEHDGIRSETICISVDNVPTRRAAQAFLSKLIVNGWTGDQALGASWHIFSRNAACLACLYHPTGPQPSQTEQVANALGLSPERAALLWIGRVPLTEDDIRVAAKKLGVAVEELSAWQGKSLGEFYSDVVCGAAPIKLPVSNRVESVPLAHQSALAGILMAAEVLKRTDPVLAELSQSEPLVSWDDILRPAPQIWTKPRAREAGCICGDRIYQEVYRSKWESTQAFPFVIDP